MSATAADFARAIVPIAHEILGEPSTDSSTELRFGRRGSIRIDKATGTFHDFEDDAKGGVIPFVMKYKALPKSEAVAFIADRGFIEPFEETWWGIPIRDKYSYHDAGGKLAFQVLRLEPKDFRQRRPDPGAQGKWLASTAGLKLPIYRLPEVLQTVAHGQTIYVAEGEKGVDALRTIGVTATCSSGGAGKWRPHHSEWLRDANVTILPDNDEPGEGHARLVARELARVGAHVRILRLPDLAPKEDPYDWIARGGTRQELERLAAAIPLQSPSGKPETGRTQPGEVPAEPKQPNVRAELWGEPVDFLIGNETAVPVLRADHVPEAVWHFSRDTAERMGVDPASVALSAIVACASVASDEWEVQPKRFDTTWTEQPRVWAAVVGNPSILKTPVIRAATKPIDVLEAEARERHKVAMREWKLKEHEAKQAKELPPAAPKLERFIVEGTTVEALTEILRDDDDAKLCAPQKKLLCRQDEMTGFFASLDRYKGGGKGGGDRAAYLTLYNGGRAVVDRIGRGHFVAPNWSATFLGGIQPEPFRKIAQDASEDGLLQRFMFAVPGSQRQGIDRQPNDTAVKRYYALFPALAALRPAIPPGADRPRPVVFHAEAHRHREDIDALADSQMSLPDTSDRMIATLGKWRGLFARLCLIFHLVETADARAQARPVQPLDVIPEAIAAKVARFIREIVFPHALRAEAVMFGTEQTNHAAWVAGYILSRKLERIASRDILQAYRPLRAGEHHRTLQAVMASLVVMNWLEPVEPSNSAKGVTSWLVNPAVHERFASQAASEELRRAAERDKIARAVEARRTATRH